MERAEGLHFQASPPSLVGQGVASQFWFTSHINLLLVSTQWLGLAAVKEVVTSYNCKVLP